MKTIAPIIVSGILFLNHSLSTATIPSISIDRNSVTITADTDDDDTQISTISIDRSDLDRPHILRIQGSPRMERAEVKVNGKVVKSIVNGSLEINLAPMMTSGRYEVDISGTLPQANDTVSVNFTGKNTSFTHQSSGNRTIEQKLTIDVR
jgi:hypothetical protein